MLVPVGGYGMCAAQPRVEDTPGFPRSRPGRVRIGMRHGSRTIIRGPANYMIVARVQGGANMATGMVSVPGNPDLEVH